MKLTKIEPEWQPITLQAGWTGIALARIAAGRVTIRLEATRGEGAGGTILLLPLSMVPGFRTVWNLEPVVGIGGSNRTVMWATAGNRGLSVPSNAATGVQFLGEFTYTI